MISHPDSFNEGSQHMFSLRNKKNYLLFIIFSGFPWAVTSVCGGFVSTLDTYILVEIFCLRRAISWFRSKCNKLH